MGCCLFGGPQGKVFDGAGGFAFNLVRERGVKVAHAVYDLDIHENLPRKWVREVSADPSQVIPGHGQLRPEQQETDRLRKEVARLKAERDILRKGELANAFIAMHRSVWRAHHHRGRAAWHPGATNMLRIAYVGREGAAGN